MTVARLRYATYRLISAEAGNVHFAATGNPGRGVMFACFAPSFGLHGRTYSIVTQGHPPSGRQLSNHYL
jgi:hypothetical protein